MCVCGLLVFMDYWFASLYLCFGLCCVCLLMVSFVAGVIRQAQPYTREERKVGRNEPCPCGSGKKYKQCHGKL